MESSALSLNTPLEVGKFLADRARTLRLQKGWTRNTLASRAGVSPASLKRFETTGKASLELVLNVAHALSRLDEFNKILAPRTARSMADLDAMTSRPFRKRGRI